MYCMEKNTHHQVNVANVKKLVSFHCSLTLKESRGVSKYTKGSTNTYKTSLSPKRTWFL